MKVFIHYEDNKDTELHKSLKLTLPKSWKNGSVSKILSQFVETYNSNDRFGAKNPLIESELHLGTEVEGDNDDNTNHKTNMDSLVEEVPSSPCKKIKALASNAITIEVLNDRDSIYVCHGPSQTVEEVLALQKKRRRTNTNKNWHRRWHAYVLGVKNDFPRKVRIRKTVHIINHRPYFMKLQNFGHVVPSKRPMIGMNFNPYLDVVPLMLVLT
mmetsp:Transcript_13817/g.13397  ORF Transcript_13817/g.13397 Transcript_13817/m.13397 type:complete len:213 (-) Transcript_13817:297-935(-)